MRFGKDSDMSARCFETSMCKEVSRVQCSVDEGPNRKAGKPPPGHNRL